MNLPSRIQRQRTKGFRLQAQSPDSRPVVSVCRPGKWGNEFRVVPEGGAWFVVDGNGVPWGPPAGFTTRPGAAAYAVRFYGGGWMEGKVGSGQLNPHELRGQHLACFCDLASPCHADALLRWANEPALLWHRYDYLLRLPRAHSQVEATELAELRALLIAAGIVTEATTF